MNRDCADVQVATLADLYDLLTLAFHHAVALKVITGVLFPTCNDYSAIS